MFVKMIKYSKYLVVDTLFKIVHMITDFGNCFLITVGKYNQVFQIPLLLKTFLELMKIMAIWNRSTCPVSLRLDHA